MNWWKIILFAIVLVLAVYLGLTLVSFLFGIIWYLLFIGIIALGGYAGFKYLTNRKTNQIEGVDNISQIELDNAKIVRELEEIKRKINQ